MGLEEAEERDDEHKSVLNRKFCYILQGNDKDEETLSMSRCHVLVVVFAVLQMVPASDFNLTEIGVRLPLQKKSGPVRRG
jgi:hypothetical protein